jgi:hypothetical protein
MINFNQPVSDNPLTGFMRQPKIYIKLPSGGAFWPRGSISMPDNGDLAVYSMTAKDELTFKTPDALLNGQAVVDVIQSCVPAIKDAWKTPAMDMDMILIAIRLATYGEMMDVSHTVPNTTEDANHQIDLRILLDSLSSAGIWEDSVELADNLTCFVRPLTYKDVTQAGLRSFEAQRMIQQVTNDELGEDRKIEILNSTFDTIADINFDLVMRSIVAIQTEDTVVEEPEFIREFFQNSDKTMFERVQAHLTHLKTLNTIKPLTFEADAEQIAQGAPATYELPIRMDNADFFVFGS